MRLKPKNHICFIVTILSFTIAVSLNCVEESLPTPTPLESIPLVTYWDIGDSYNFTITRVTERYVDENLVKFDSTMVETHLTVIDSTADFYKVRWSYFYNISNDFDLPQETVAILEKLCNVNVIYSITATGEFLHVDNWQAISAKMDSIYTIIYDNLPKEKQVDQVRRTFEMFKELYSTQAGVEFYLVDELYLIHFPFGIEYTLHDTMKYENETPNMLGENTIRSNAEIYLEDIDHENYLCRVINKQQLNPDDAKSAIKDYLVSFEVPEDEISTNLDDAIYQFNDIAYYDYFYYPGLPLQIYNYKETLVNIKESNVEQYERIIISLNFEE